MRILVSNDDGYFSPGIEALVSAVSDLADELTVVAPERDRSGASNSLTLDPYLCGENGNGLSGGEKQRIAIARAILKNAPIVILDEATAFTDPQNEDKIQKSIMAFSKGKTLLVIAHRLSTIQNADQIVVLKKGQIVDCGKQGELLERCPLYADMWQAHIGAKNWSVGEKKEVAGNV